MRSPSGNLNRSGSTLWLAGADVRLAYIAVEQQQRQQQPPNNIGRKLSYRSDSCVLQTMISASRKTWARARERDGQRRRRWRIKLHAGYKQFIHQWFIPKRVSARSIQRASRKQEDTSARCFSPVVNSSGLSVSARRGAPRTPLVSQSPRLLAFRRLSLVKKIYPKMRTRETSR